MKNLIFTIDKDALNTDEVQYIDPVLIITRTGEMGLNPRDETYYPNEMRIQNDSGVTIKFNILDDANEFNEFYYDSAAYYEMLSLSDNTSMANANLQQAYRILIKKSVNDDTADGNVTIFCVNYTQRGL